MLLRVKTQTDLTEILELSLKVALDLLKDYHSFTHDPQTYRTILMLHCLKWRVFFYSLALKYSMAKIRQEKVVVID